MTMKITFRVWEYLTFALNSLFIFIHLNATSFANSIHNYIDIININRTFTRGMEATGERHIKLSQPEAITLPITESAAIYQLNYIACYMFTWNHNQNVRWEKGSPSCQSWFQENQKHVTFIEIIIQQHDTSQSSHCSLRTKVVLLATLEARELSQYFQQLQQTEKRGPLFTSKHLQCLQKCLFLFL